MELRKYQIDAIAALHTDLATYDSSLCVMPTGTGKTIVASTFIDEFLTHHGRAALFLAHREELLTQTQEKIRRTTTRTTGIEQGEHSVAGLLRPPDVVIASVPTLSKERRMQAFPPGTFSLIVSDESQHAPASTYRAIYEYFDAYKHVGLTATPTRADKKALGTIFEHVAFTYDIRDAIEQGYLVPIIRQRVIVQDLDLSRVRTSHGDFVDGDLERQFINEKCLHEVVDPTLRLAGTRPTLIFCPGVRHAHAIAALINTYAEQTVAAAIDGQTSKEERPKILHAFHTGELQFLANVDVLTEGVDIPPIACIANCRPTKSRTRYVQAVGRGTRLSPGKQNLLVLDFTDASQQHQLASTFDILDGNMDLEVKARAEQLSDADPEMTATDALDMATSQLADEKRVKLIAQTQFQVIEIDTLDLLGVRLRPGRWGGIESTGPQLEMLTKAGIAHPERFDKGESHQVISAIVQRREAGLCTIKMAKVLAKHGLNPDVSFAVAHQQIDFIASRRWNLSPQDREIAKQLGGRVAA